ncbi:MAG: hypothetical protein HKN18_03615 [Silicimonas sp.]|nr:hypothetical protein [Silicimonas sp.]
MNQITLAIILVGATVTGAILYSNGAFETGPEELPFESALQDKLVDPDYRMRNVREDSGFGFDPPRFFCGEINSKNRMGGFTGWQTFVAMDPHGKGNWQVTFEEEVPPSTLENYPCR